jgi:type I restriction enzyme S subunit
MKKYDSYKNSGIEWLKEIPKGWNLARMRYVCDISTGDKDTINKEENGNYPFYVRSKNIERISTYTYDEEAILTPGDGDICKIWHYINGKFECHQRVYKLSKFSEVTGKFLYYFLMQNFENEVFKLSAKSTVDSLRRPMFQNFPIAFGTIEEQNIITYFLDNKTTQIDDLISKKEQFIQLLEEERIAVINQAVTKGLDVNVSMKDSDIEWLGEIPEHWEMKKLRFIGNCQNGISAGAEYFGKGFPFVSYGDVYKNEILPILVNGLAQSNEKEQLHYSIDEGDVLFTRTSETIEEIGISSICFQKIKGAVFAGFLIRFRPNEGNLNKNFSKYFFRSKIPRTFFVKEMNLVTRASLSQELLKRLPILLPPIEEQKKIGEFLNKKTNEIDDIVGKTRNEIELLKEYKSALISEVVTGKVDVSTSSTQALGTKN